jgi:hypothetical protein
MENTFLIIPILLFMISIVLGFMDKSLSIFNKYNLPTKKKNYVFAIPIKEIKENIKNSDNLTIVTELKRCVKVRQWHFIFLILCFFSIIIVSFFNR